MTLLRWLAFLLGSLTVTLTVYSVWIYFCSVWFISSDTSICSAMVFSPLGNSDHVLVSCCFHWLSIKLKMGCLLTSHSWWLFPCWMGQTSQSFESYSLGDIFKLLYVYITHCKYQVKPLSSWFSAGCAAAIFHRNHFFVCTNIMNILNLKVKFSQASNYCKGFFKLPKLHVLINLKSPSLPGNLALRTFYELLIVFSKKVNLLYSLYSMAQRCCLLHLIKQNC